MNLLADESMDKPIVEQLRQDGHDVLYVAEMEPGISDEVVLQRANEHQALLITEDKDFWRIGVSSRLGSSWRYFSSSCRVGARNESARRLKNNCRTGNRNARRLQRYFSGHS